ncbi:MAG: sulfate ABC transporter substrate-binding protein [Nocardioidaceae bacterium]|nr:sulfate ABC transporter substrate-binding protein [Nocardioidaceae bacterium]
MRARSLAAVLALAGLLAVTGCASTSGGSGDGSGGADLSVVGFSVLEAANEPVLADFEETDAGKDVTIATSYGASGDQSRAVEGGLDADLVHLSLEPDMQRLVDSGQVDASWKDNATQGIATSSVVVMVVRPGNPQGIQGWDDLVKPGVEIITPNPASSGSAKWNILAAWAHITGAGGSEDEAKAYVARLLGNTIALPSSARDATTAFTEGNGDVLLSYENEAIIARANGADVDYVVPDDTLLIQNPAAVLEDADPRAADLLALMTSAEGQADYAESGFRPVIDGVTLPEVVGANDPANPFPQPTSLYTIDDDFGGWATANTTFFDEDNGVITLLQQETGTLE